MSANVIVLIPITANASGSLKPAVSFSQKWDVPSYYYARTRQVEEIRILVKVIKDVSGSVDNV